MSEQGAMECWSAGSLGRLQIKSGNFEDLVLGEYWSYGSKILCVVFDACYVDAIKILSS